MEKKCCPDPGCSHSLVTAATLEAAKLSVAERQMILNVLKRNEQIQKDQHYRIMKLKAELQILRRKGALKTSVDYDAPGPDPERSCGRCRAELGRVINRGAECRACRLKVCKNCRHYSTRTSEWVCTVCHKHMEIQAASGEWMNEFVRRPSRRRDNRVYVPAADLIKRTIRRSWTISNPSPRWTAVRGSPETRPYNSLPRDQDITKYPTLMAHQNSRNAARHSPARRAHSEDVYSEQTAAPPTITEAKAVPKPDDEPRKQPRINPLIKYASERRRDKNSDSDNSEGEDGFLKKSKRKLQHAKSEGAPGKEGKRVSFSEEGVESVEEQEDLPIELCDIEPLSGTVFRKVTVRRRRQDMKKMQAIDAGWRRSADSDLFELFLPEGDDYKLVFLSSDSSSKEEDVDDNDSCSTASSFPIDECDWDYFEPGGGKPVFGWNGSPRVYRRHKEPLDAIASEDCLTCEAGGTVDGAGVRCLHQVEQARSPCRSCGTFPTTQYIPIPVPVPVPVPFSLPESIEAVEALRAQMRVLPRALWSYLNQAALIWPLVLQGERLEAPAEHNRPDVKSAATATTAQTQTQTQTMQADAEAEEVRLSGTDESSNESSDEEGVDRVGNLRTYTVTASDDDSQAHRDMRDDSTSTSTSNDDNSDDDNEDTDGTTAKLKKTKKKRKTSRIYVVNKHPASSSGTNSSETSSDSSDNDTDVDFECENITLLGVRSLELNEHFCDKNQQILVDNKSSNNNPALQEDSPVSETNYSKTNQGFNETTEKNQKNHAGTKKGCRNNNEVEENFKTDNKLQENIEVTLEKLSSEKTASKNISKEKNALARISKINPYKNQDATIKNTKLSIKENSSEFLCSEENTLRQIKHEELTKVNLSREESLSKKLSNEANALTRTNIINQNNQEDATKVTAINHKILRKENASEKLSNEENALTRTNIVNHNNHEGATKVTVENLSVAENASKKLSNEENATGPATHFCDKNNSVNNDNTCEDIIDSRVETFDLCLETLENLQNASNLSENNLQEHQKNAFKEEIAWIKREKANIQENIIVYEEIGEKNGIISRIDEENGNATLNRAKSAGKTAKIQEITLTNKEIANLCVDYNGNAGLKQETALVNQENAKMKEYPGANEEKILPNEDFLEENANIDNKNASTSEETSKIRKNPGKSEENLAINKEISKIDKNSSDIEENSLINEEIYVPKANTSEKSAKIKNISGENEENLLVNQDFHEENANIYDKNANSSQETPKITKNPSKNQESFIKEEISVISEENSKMKKNPDKNEENSLRTNTEQAILKEDNQKLSEETTEKNNYLSKNEENPKLKPENEETRKIMDNVEEINENFGENVHNLHKNILILHEDALNNTKTHVKNSNEPANTTDKPADTTNTPVDGTNTPADRISTPEECSNIIEEGPNILKEAINKLEEAANTPEDPKIPAESANTLEDTDNALENSNKPVECVNRFEDTANVLGEWNKTCEIRSYTLEKMANIQQESANTPLKNLGMSENNSSEKYCKKEPTRNASVSLEDLNTPTEYSNTKKEDNFNTLENSQIYSNISEDNFNKHPVKVNTGESRDCSPENHVKTTCAVPPNTPKPKKRKDKSNTREETASAGENNTFQEKPIPSKRKERNNTPQKGLDACKESSNILKEGPNTLSKITNTHVEVPNTPGEPNTLEEDTYEVGEDMPRPNKRQSRADAREERANTLRDWANTAYKSPGALGETAFSANKGEDVGNICDGSTNTRRDWANTRKKWSDSALSCEEAFDFPEDNLKSAISSEDLILAYANPSYGDFFSEDDAIPSPCLSAVSAESLNSMSDASERVEGERAGAAHEPHSSLQTQSQSKTRHAARYTSLVMITQDAYAPVSVVTSDTTTLVDDVVVRHTNYATHKLEETAGNDDVTVVTGENTQTVVCLEEGLADDDSWVENLSHDDDNDEDNNTSSGEEVTLHCTAAIDHEDELRGYHRSAIDFTLHTILEESCEESDVEVRNEPTDLEKYFYGMADNASNNPNDNDDYSEISSVYSMDDSIVNDEGEDEYVQKAGGDNNDNDDDYPPPSKLEQYFLSGFKNFNSDGSVGSDSEGRPSPEQRRKRLVRARGTGRSHSSSLDNLLSNPDLSEANENLAEDSDSDTCDESTFDKNDGQFDTLKHKKKKVNNLSDEDAGCKTPQPSDMQPFSSSDKNKQQSRDSGFVGSSDDLIKDTLEITKPDTKLYNITEESQNVNKNVAAASMNIIPQAPPPVTSLTRKDSFNNWSSDEETNLMMCKMHQFFKTMVVKQPVINVESPKPRLKHRHKSPQLIYFENELTRLMKTVPGIRDDQVREIVEYLSSEDTWSDSYDSSDYTSSDLDTTSNSAKKSVIQKQISESCKEIINKFETGDHEGDEGDGGIESRGINKETAFVYQKLVASFEKMATEEKTTPTNSPPLIAKVMHHIGTRLVALMHEVSSGESQISNSPKVARHYHKKLQPKISSNSTTEEDDNSDLDNLIDDGISYNFLPRSKSHDPLLLESKPHQSSITDIAEEREVSDCERFSWRGSFESALLATDSRNKLSESPSVLAAKRRSAGDLLFTHKSLSREQLDRVRSCGSIGGNTSEDWTSRRSSIPDASSDDDLDARSTLPRSLQSNAATTNSLPRLPTNTPPSSMLKAQSMYHFIQQNVKSARYRPPGFNRVVNSVPKRAASAPGLQPTPQRRGRRATTIVPNDDANLSEAHSSPMLASRASKSATPSPVAHKSRRGLGGAPEWHSNEEDIDTLVAIHNTRSSFSNLGSRSDSMASVYSGAGEGRYGTVAVKGQIEFGLQYNYKANALEINVKQCKDLASVDLKRNRSDPYVKVYLLPDKSKGGKRKTKVKKHTLNPVFDETLKFHITLNGLETRTLWLTVWHSDMFGRNDFLGEVMMNLENMVFDDPTPKWYNLQERTEPFDDMLSFKGDILIGLKFVPPDMTAHKKGKRSRGALLVLVKEAKSLTAIKANGTSDPFCKSYLLPDKGRSGKQKTSVVRRTVNPVWNHTFIYDDVTLQELAERCLELTVWDHDRLASNEFLGGVRFSLGTGKHYGKPVDWMDATGKELILWKSMLERPNFWVEGCLSLRPTLDNQTT